MPDDAWLREVQATGRIGRVARKEGRYREAARLSEADGALLVLVDDDSGDAQSGVVVPLDVPDRVEELALVKALLRQIGIGAEFEALALPDIDTDSWAGDVEAFVRARLRLMPAPVAQATGRARA